MGRDGMAVRWYAGVGWRWHGDVVVWVKWCVIGGGGERAKKKEEMVCLAIYSQKRVGSIRFTHFSFLPVQAFFSHFMEPLEIASCSEWFNLPFHT